MQAAHPVEVPYGPHLADRAAGDDLLHFPVVLAVAVLVADDRLDARRVERLFDREPSALVIATGFSKAMSFAPLRMPISTSSSHLGGVQKQKTWVSPGWRAHSDRSWSSPCRAWRPRRTAAPGSAADAGELESRIGSERRGMVHAALAHADDDDAVGHHFGALSHSRTLPMT